jgi:Lon protease-like protein
VLPLFPLGTVLVPGMRLSLHVFEPRYRQLVADLLGGEEPGVPEFGVVALRQGWEVGELGEIHHIGTSARITGVLPHPDGRCDLAAIGERRFVIEELDTVSKPYLLGTVRWLAEPEGDLGPELAAAARRALELHLRTLIALHADPGVAGELAEATADPLALSYAVARLPSLPLADRQALLGVPDTASRLQAGRAVLRRETELLRQLRAVPISAATFRRPGTS